MAIPTKEEILFPLHTHCDEELEMMWTEAGAKKAMDIHSKNIAIGFFKWNAEKVSEYIDYLKRVDFADGLTEKETELNKFENGTIEDRFNQYLQSLTQQ